MTTIGLIGLGTMGCRAAEKILMAGHTIRVFDPSPAAQRNGRALKAEISATPAEAAQGAELILMFLPGPREVEKCVNGPDGLLLGAPAGSALIDLSTVDPATTMRMADAARASGIGYLDAPVLGRPASVGNWALPVGGDGETLERCRPVLGLLAAKIFHIGPSGSGNRVKLLNQLMFGAINAMTAEMMAIAAKMGISQRLLYETISSSQAATVSNLFIELGRRISAEEYSEPTFTVDLLAKDVRLAVQMAQESTAVPILAKAVENINETAQAQGFGNFDTSIMWKSYENLWKEARGE